MGVQLLRCQSLSVGFHPVKPPGRVPTLPITGLQFCFPWFVSNMACTGKLCSWTIPFLIATEADVWGSETRPLSYPRGPSPTSRTVLATHHRLPLCWQLVSPLIPLHSPLPLHLSVRL